MVEGESWINRRSFLTKASVAALAAGGAAALAGTKTSEGAAAAATDTTKTFRWRLQHIEPSTSANYKIYEQWAKDINTASNGRLQIRLFPAGSLAPNEEAFDAVGKGQFEMAVSSPGYHRAKMPEIEAVNPPHAHRNLTDLLLIYYKGGLRDFYRESYAAHNIFLLDMAAWLTDRRPARFSLRSAPGREAPLRPGLPVARRLRAGRPTRQCPDPALRGRVAVPCALASGAARIRVLHPNPHIADQIRTHYSLPVTDGNQRSYLAQTAERYDVVHVENWGASLPGADALDQDHLLTVEAFGEYLRRLAPGGVLIVSRRLRLPPADSLRLWAAAREALAREGASTPTRSSSARVWAT